MKRLVFILVSSSASVAQAHGHLMPHTHGAHDGVITDLVLGLGALGIVGALAWAAWTVLTRKQEG